MPIKDPDDAVHAESRIKRTFDTAPCERLAGICARFIKVLDFDRDSGLVSLAGAPAPLRCPAVGASSRRRASRRGRRPSAGETLVLLSAAGTRVCYAVDPNLNPRSISPAQLVAAAKCDENTPIEPVPEATNERAMKAFGTFKGGLQDSLGWSLKVAKHTRVPLRVHTAQRRDLRGRSRERSGPPASATPVFQARPAAQIGSALGVQDATPRRLAARDTAGGLAPGIPTGTNESHRLLRLLRERTRGRLPVESGHRRRQNLPRRFPPSLSFTMSYPPMQCSPSRDCPIN